MSDIHILRLGAKALAASDWVLDALERRRERRQLAELDDRILHDIGVSRADIDAELRRPWWRLDLAQGGTRRGGPGSS